MLPNSCLQFVSLKVITQEKETKKQYSCIPFDTNVGCCAGNCYFTLLVSGRGLDVGRE
jgi:hypothetical protein